MESMGAGLYVVVGLFLLVLAVLWFLLPFAVFGTKDKLTEIVNETQATNRAINALTEEVAKLRKGMAAAWEQEHRSP